MFEVIKGSNPFKNVVIEGEAIISNRIIGEIEETEDEKTDDEDGAETESENTGEEGAEENQGPPKINFAELEDLRDQYRREGQEYAVAMHKRADAEFEKARAEAEKIVEEAKEKGRRLLAQIDEKADATYDEAKKRGLDEGFDEGVKKGEEEGYLQGLKKCQEALSELKQLCESVEREKADIMAENRRGIFDLAMSVAEKITVTVFNQKDKKALEKMITAAAKEFRNAKNIRVTLSRHDVSENMEADFRIYEKCFAPTVNVEFEVVDAESGTLMLENETEIFDAGVSTQLKMIGELGRGKFREKEEEPREGDETALEAASAQVQAQVQPKPEPKPEVKSEAKPAKAPRTSRASKAVKEAKTAVTEAFGAVSEAVGAVSENAAPPAQRTDIMAAPDSAVGNAVSEADGHVVNETAEAVSAEAPVSVSAAAKGSTPIVAAYEPELDTGLDKPEEQIFSGFTTDEQ